MASGAGASAGAGGSDDGCTAALTQCADCIDNDGDGQVDAWDPECVGPLDNDEGAFTKSIPDRFRNCQWVDCYFDGSAGSGDDKCQMSPTCDPLKPYETICGYDPRSECLALAPECLDNCLPLTPNGCDCFGCCSVPLADGSTVRVLLESFGCDRAHAGDPAICHPCTGTPACDNPCETCEYCLGKHELPPECGGVADPCPGGAQACAPDVACPPSFYCLTGCCIEFPR